MDDLQRYRRELEKVNEQLRESGADERLSQIKEKLSRIVTLLEAKNPPQKPQPIPDGLNGVAMGSPILVQLDNRWFNGEVVQMGLPNFITVIVPELGRSVKVKNFKRLKCLKPITTHSNPSLPPTETRKDQKAKPRKQPRTANKKKDSEYERATSERQQSWQDFKKLKRLNG